MTVHDPLGRRRRYVTVPMSHETLACPDPWWLFRVVAQAVRANGMDPAKLEYRSHRETPIGVTAVFEVMP